MPPGCFTGCPPGSIELDEKCYRSTIFTNQTVAIGLCGFNEEVVDDIDIYNYARNNGGFKVLPQSTKPFLVLVCPVNISLFSSTGPLLLQVCMPQRPSIAMKMAMVIQSSGSMRLSPSKSPTQQYGITWSVFQKTI